MGGEAQWAVDEHGMSFLRPHSLKKVAEAEVRCPSRLSAYQDASALNRI